MKKLAAAAMTALIAIGCGQALADNHRSSSLVDRLGYGKHQLAVDFVGFWKEPENNAGYLRLDINGVVQPGYLLDLESTYDGYGGYFDYYLPLPNLGGRVGRYTFLQFLANYYDAEAEDAVRNIAPVGNAILIPGFGPDANAQLNPNGIAVGITPGVTQIERADYKADISGWKVGVGVGSVFDLSPTTALKAKVGMSFGDSEVDTRLSGRINTVGGLVTNEYRYDTMLWGGGVHGGLMLYQQVVPGVVVFGGGEAGIDYYDVETDGSLAVDAFGNPFERQTIKLEDDDFRLNLRAEFGLMWHNDVWKLKAGGFVEYGGYAPDIHVPGGGERASLSGQDLFTKGVKLGLQVGFCVFARALRSPPNTPAPWA